MKLFNLFILIALSSSTFAQTIHHIELKNKDNKVYEFRKNDRIYIKKSLINDRTSIKLLYKGEQITINKDQLNSEISTDYTLWFTNDTISNHKSSKMYKWNEKIRIHIPKNEEFQVKLEPDGETFKFINYKKIEQPQEIKEAEIDKKHIAETSNTDVYKISKINFKTGDNILNDAKRLIDLDEELEVKKEIIDKYGTTKENVFLKAANILEENHFKPSGSMGSNIAKTDVTNFATGMARFLAERAKQELNETFFIQMHNQMQKLPELQVYFPQSYKFLKHLDANTMSFDLEYLKTRFELDIKFLPKHILVSIDEADENKYPYFKTANQYFNNNVNGLWLNIGLHSVLNSNGNINPKDLLYHFVHSKGKEQKGLLLDLETKLKNYDDKNQINLINSIKLAELISNSLLSPETGRYWVSSKEINELISNENLFQTYIGLLLAKSEFNEYKVKFNDTSLKDLVELKYTENNVVKNNIADLKNLILEIYQTYHNVEEKVNSFKDIKDERVLAEKSYDAFSLVKTSVSTIKDLVSNKSYLGTKDIKIDESVLTNYIDPTVEIAYNLFNKKYNVAIKNFIYILNQVPSVSKVISDYDLVNLVESVDLDDTKKLNRDKLMTTFLQQKNVRQSLITSEIFTDEQIEDFINNDSISKTDLLKLVKHNQTEIYNYLSKSKQVENFLKSNNGNYSKFISKFSTYGTLIANVATAQNSDEVKAAIEASVLPVGSSRMKRNSNWSITANAYVGAFYGNAFYKELVDGALEKRSINTFGVTAPIGISFSKGNLKVFNQNTSLGINLQLIDLGSLVNFYMKEGDGASLPRDTQIKLGDIIAPGGSLSYSIGDSPFTLLGGIQYVPNLNRMESIPTNSDFKPVAWRVHFGLAIDIPLFNIKIWN